MSTGWIKLYRSITGWEWFDDAETLRFFIYIVVKANYETKRWHGITVERGQLICSADSLVNELHLSRQRVRTFINRLKSTNEITTKSTNKFTIITICNYDSYQDEEMEEQPTKPQQTNQQATNKQPTSNQQLTTTKKYKENKEKNKDNNYIFSAGLKNLGVDDDLIDEWLVIRKAKRGVNSQFALNTFVKECEKTGHTVNDIVRLCCQRQWVGFKAEWLQRITTSTENAQDDISRITEYLNAVATAKHNN